MNMKIYFNLLLLIFTTSIFAQTDETICKDLDHLLENEAHHHSQLIQFRSNEYTENYDLKYHRLEWDVDPAEYYIQGVVTSFFVPLEADFQEINFDLSSDLTVNEVLYHGTALSYTLHDDDRLQIFLPATITENTLDSISVDYEGQPGSSGFGAFATSTHNGAPALWTLSEPYGAKEWWPCKQSLDDKIDSIDVIVRTPAENRVASNGSLISEIEDGSDKIFHWKHRYPIPAYLIAIASTNYAVFSDFVELPDGQSIEILNYVYPENLAQAHSSLSNTVQIMELFNELFGVYPFASEKYGHAQFGWGGGMEHQTMSFMGGFSFSLQAHELAHQWFGDKVTCGSWEHIWLNEGFATYLTGLTNEFILGQSAWTNWKQGQISNVTSQAGGSVWVSDTTSVGRIFSGRLSYAKGSLLLHMLRWEMGDDAFFQALRNYLQNPDRAFNYALTANLQTELEAESGLDLDEFFNDWFYGEGYPSYHIQWASNSSNDFQLYLNQTTSHTSVDFFEMTLPILVSGQGQDSLLRIPHTNNGQVLNFNLPFEVENVSFDPELWICSTQNLVENVDFVTSTNTISELIGIKLYPNPANDFVFIEFTDNNEVAGKIILRNQLGQEVRQREINGAKTQIPTNTLTPGIYTLEILTKEGRKTSLLEIE